VFDIAAGFAQLDHHQLPRPKWLQEGAEWSSLTLWAEKRFNRRDQEKRKEMAPKADARKKSSNNRACIPGGGEGKVPRESSRWPKNQEDCLGGEIKERAGPEANRRDFCGEPAKGCGGE